MLYNGWSIALLICSLSLLFLLITAFVNGIRVLKHWNHEKDSALQLALENQQLLISTLMQYGMVFQIFSLFLLVWAADSFADILVGAMCATGAFMANQYGVYTLLLKILLLFLCGYWLLLHRLDLKSEFYPLVRLKNGFLLILTPLLILDFSFQGAYLLGLEPDVITSCCGVLFRPDSGDGYNLLSPASTPFVLGLFYSLALLLVILGGRLLWRLRAQKSEVALTAYCFGVCWVPFFLVSLWAITVFFSSYIYAIPSHRCPFDILMSEYDYIGYPIYFTLFGGTFLGSGTAVSQWVSNRADLKSIVYPFQVSAVGGSLLLLLFFLSITAYAPISYLLAGGEV